MRFGEFQTGPANRITLTVIALLSCVQVNAQTPRTTKPDAAARSDDQFDVSDDALVRRARTSLAAERASEAIPILLDVLRRNPRDIECLRLLGEAYVATDDGRRAIVLLERATQRDPQEPALWLARADCLLALHRPAGALDCIEAAQRHIGPNPELSLCAARALFDLGEYLGEVEVRAEPGGQVGQFVGDWYLVEPRGAIEFLCCPPRSALYQIRRALDGGIDLPDAHLLHAEVWRRIGRPQRAWSVLERSEAALLEHATTRVLTIFADTALAAGHIKAYLRYARRRAQLDDEAAGAILAEAYRNVAQHYNRKGDAALYRAFLSRALTASPQDVDLKFEFAEALWESGKRQDAARWYRRVLEQTPDHLQAVRILERLLEVETTED